MRRPSRSPSSRSTSAGSSRRSPRRGCRRRRSTCPPGHSSSRPTRAGSSGSSATCSTTPANTPPARRSTSRSRWTASDRPAVADRGPGVPPDRLGRIFDRFYKADPSRRGGSSGLGLAIAAEHAALLGGTLRATKRPGGGLRIELRLPVTQSLPAATERRTVGTRLGLRTHPSGDPFMNRRRPDPRRSRYSSPGRRPHCHVRRSVRPTACRPSDRPGARLTPAPPGEPL